MNSTSYLLLYWAVCLALWWVLAGKILSNRYAELTGSKDSTDRYERRMIVFLVLIDFIFAPLFVPMALFQRGIAGLHKHYVSIK